MLFLLACSVLAGFLAATACLIGLVTVHVISETLK